MIYNLVLNSTNVIDLINKTQYAYTSIDGKFYIPENLKNMYQSVYDSLFLV